MKKHNHTSTFSMADEMKDILYYKKDDPKIDSEIFHLIRSPIVTNTWDKVLDSTFFSEDLKEKIHEEA